MHVAWCINLKATRKTFGMHGDGIIPATLYPKGKKNITFQKVHIAYARVF